MHTEWFLVLTLLSLAAAAAPWMIPTPKIYVWVQFGLSLVQCLASAWLAFGILEHGSLTGWGGWLRLDGFGGYNLWLITLVGTLSSLFSISYLPKLNQERTSAGSASKRGYRERGYYSGLHLFILSMVWVSMSNHPGILWVSMEATTLISALLVAYNRGGAALEAAWKYLIVGSVGIALAFFGIILLFGSVPASLLQEHFFWTDFIRHAGELHAEWVKLAFLFILVGFGTKVGLAPMHFWLPDAHSQAPSPVSALLSAALLQTALLAVMRVKSIVDLVSPGFAGHLLIGFGLLSLIVTVPFFMVQHDIKRLLAYSSIEHMGIIALGFGLGGTAYIGALLHTFNHAMGKSLLFFTSGSMVEAYHTHRIERISGVIRRMPFTGTAFLIGAFAITGMPPFSLFISEFLIASAAFRSGYGFAGVILLMCVILIFSGMMYYAIRMIYGHAGNSAPLRTDWRESGAVAILIPLLAVVIMGLYIPVTFYHLLSEIAKAL